MEKDITIHGFYFDPALGLQVDDLKKMPAGTIFAKGEMPDSPDGINMTGTGHMLRWIAKRGDGYHDWTIYCYWAKGGGEYDGSLEYDTDWDFIKTNGGKVRDNRNIRKCINASDEAMKLYRK